MAYGGKDHRIEIGIQAVLLQPVGHLVLTDEVGDDPQLVAALMQALDNLHTAVHHHPAALGLPVLEAQLMAHRIVVRQQPFAPQFFISGLLVLAQRPLAVRLVALLDHLIEFLIRHIRACDLRHFPTGVAHIGLLQESNAQSAAQVEKDGFILFFHRSSFKPAQGRCPAIQKGW